MVTDSVNNIIVGLIAEGAGKIAFTTLYNTYNWLLAGNTSNYYSFWSGLLQKTARLKNPEPSVETVAQLPVEQQPVSVIYRTNSDVSPLVKSNGEKLALAQNENLPDQWNGTFWPIKPGWQLLLPFIICCAFLWMERKIF